jgi:spore coat protein H
VDELAAALRPAVQEESSDKLVRFDKVIAGQPASAVPPGGVGLTSVVVDLLKKPPPPLVPFAQARTRSVADQLAGKSQGQTVGGFGMAPGAGGGRPGAEPPGAGQFLAPGFLSALDANKDKQLTREEFLTGFDRWFAKWDQDNTGRLTEQQLRAGLNKDLPLNFFGGRAGGGPQEEKGGQTPDSSPPRNPE